MRQIWRGVILDAQTGYLFLLNRRSEERRNEAGVGDDGDGFEARGTVCDKRLHAIAADAEEARGAFELGLEEAVGDVEAPERAVVAGEAKRAEHVAVVVQVVEVDVAVG